MKQIVRFQVLTAVSMNVIDFWDTAPYSFDVDENIMAFALMVEAVSVSGTSAYFYDPEFYYIHETIY
jgi:hypothetical protein